MNVSMLRTKLHRATVTGADLNYEGSVSICPDLIKASGLLINEKVDIYNCNNGARFSTYVIKGKKGEICLNGAAARHVQKGDLVIIVSYCGLSFEEAQKHEPTVIFVDEKNRIKEKRKESRKNNK
ncbi:aspartate 1-decarboxylase [Bdellovibrio sp. HCB2-146]|uniref:aspartate 1-decarboxylase n=1 Tax=Bdellovibrio sp. HCB2-146 TaxID=3394362 RepID=UPI0039BC410C